MLVVLAFCAKCLEGTTERSDSNRVRSARIGEARTMCLEGTTPQDVCFIHRHRRTAFQGTPLSIASSGIYEGQRPVTLRVTRF